MSMHGLWDSGRLCRLEHRLQPDRPASQRCIDRACAPRTSRTSLTGVHNPTCPTSPMGVRRLRTPGCIQRGIPVRATRQNWLWSTTCQLQGLGSRQHPLHTRCGTNRLSVSHRSSTRSGLPTSRTLDSTSCLQRVPD